MIKRDRDGHRKEASLRGHQDTAVAVGAVRKVQDWPQDGSTDAGGDIGNIIR